MQYRIVQTKDRYVVGIKSTMTFQNIQQETGNLARQFMPKRYEVVARIGKHVFSIQDFGHLKLKDITPQTTFEKWVGVEVSSFDEVPENMDIFTLKAGTYVVFSFKGTITDFQKSRNYIFQNWLPNSEYVLDNRAHFEILSENYSKDLQNIEEEIWIPIKLKHVI